MITDKRRVTMTRIVSAGPGAQMKHEAVDYVPESDLERYVADARTRWATVEVSEEYDAGPGGA